MANDARIAAFLAMMFDIFGQDVQGADSQGHTLLHMIARKGDVVAPTLETLLSLHYRYKKIIIFKKIGFFYTVLTRKLDINSSLSA